MKTSMTISTILTTFFLFICLTVFAQVPQGFNYQGVARDANDKVISDDFISLRMSIVDGSANGSVVYLENHQNVPTSPQGVFTIIVGGGSSNDDFQMINWGLGSYFLRVDMDINNGTDYERMGASQLLSVPYALHAGNAGGGSNDADSDPNNEIQSLVLDGKTLGITGSNSVVLPDEVNDADADPNNEIQSLNINGTQLSISGGNSVTLPSSGGGGDADNWGAQVVSSDGTLSGDGTSGNPLKVEGDLTDDQTLIQSGDQLSISGGNTVMLPDKVNDADADPNNEIQTISRSGNDIVLSNGGGTVDVRDGDDSNANEIVTDFSLDGNFLNLEETSRAFRVDLSSISGAGSTVWSPQGNSIFYKEGEVIFGDPIAGSFDIRMSDRELRMNGVEGTEVTFNTEKLSFDPIGFTPSLGSATYGRNSFEIFSGSGQETRLTDGVLEIVENDNIMHLQPDNLHFHTASGDGFSYGNFEIRGNGGFGDEVLIDGGLGAWKDDNFQTTVSKTGFFTTFGTLGFGMAMVNVAGAKAVISTVGTDLRIDANDVGFNTFNPELEVHIAEKDVNGNYQLYLDNGSNEWILGAANSGRDLLFRYRPFDTFLALDANTLSFSAVSDKKAKKNIRAISPVLDRLIKLNVKTYEYKGSDVPTNGLIAQEVRDVMPELVREFQMTDGDGISDDTGKEEKVLALNYGQLGILNTKAIQEQQLIIDSQQQEIESLKKTLAEMKELIENLKE